MRKLLVVFVLLSVVTLGATGAWGQYSISVPVWNASFEDYYMGPPNPSNPYYVDQGGAPDDVPIPTGYNGIDAYGHWEAWGFLRSIPDGNAHDGDQVLVVDLT